jgi:hypothetical protein
MSDVQIADESGALTASFFIFSRKHIKYFKLKGLYRSIHFFIL